ncbi:hypothetical protein CEP54_014323 [Fusarium duplospermum]|uniref:Secreted protein n=1 Tax=Fusarium duplospermum TaxID=1325734 RepID=A0A428NX12_9HYPO|nr:hypothetical protein CEP54_014323 [Fusarium duplospermum]
MNITSALCALFLAMETVALPINMLKGRSILAPRLLNTKRDEAQHGSDELRTPKETIKPRLDVIRTTERISVIEHLLGIVLGALWDMPTETPPRIATSLYLLLSLESHKKRNVNHLSDMVLLQPTKFLHRSRLVLAYAS